MNPFESTIESPLRFLNSYLKHYGEGYLRKQYELSNEPDFCYDPAKEVIIVQKILPRNNLRGELLNEETNTREYELSWTEYVHDEFKRQFEISKRLIIEQSRKNGKDQDAKLYSTILIDCLETQKEIDSLPKLNFQADLNNFIQQILTFTFRKFNRYYPGITEIKRVDKYYKNRKEINLTGFRVHLQTADFEDFLKSLYSNNFVAKDTPTLSVQQFLTGKIPSVRINWMKDPHELKFFIDCLCNEKYLRKMPKQQWKHLRKVFIHDGDELEENWHRNHNKLKDIHKRIDIINLVSLLDTKYVPRIYHILD